MKRGGEGRGGGEEGREGERVKRGGEGERVKRGGEGRG